MTTDIHKTKLTIMFIYILLKLMTGWTIWICPMTDDVGVDMIIYKMTTIK